VVGGNRRFTTREVIDFLRGFVNQDMIKELSNYELTTIFTERLDNISVRTRVAIEEKLSRFRIELFDLKINRVHTRHLLHV
jgi:hypothetical protein